MQIPLISIPAGIALQYHEETGQTIPSVIRGPENTLIIPVFVRGHADGYVWIEVKVPFTGQDLSEYSKLTRQCYTELRAYFYGTPQRSWNSNTKAS